MTKVAYPEALLLFDKVSKMSNEHQIAVTNQKLFGRKSASMSTCVGSPDNAHVGSVSCHGSVTNIIYSPLLLFFCVLSQTQ